MKIDTQMSMTGSADPRPAAAEAERAGYAGAWTSMPWSHPAPRMREYILAMRAIWDCWQQGTKLDVRGDFYSHTLMTPFFNPGPNPYGAPRVLLAGVGAVMTRVAGEAADGFLDAFAVTAEPGQVAAELLRRYGDIMTRMTLYTPYPIDPVVTRQIAADLPGQVSQTAGALLAAPPLSLSLTKQGMWLALEIPSFDAAVELENRQQVLAAATADAAEAMAAYRERRDPDYRYR